MTNISAVFEKMGEGKKAVDALRETGYKRAYLDMVDNYLSEYSSEINFAGTRSAPSLSALVLKSDGHILNIDKGPLVASNPMVSGIGAYREMADAGTRLIVHVEDEKVEEVKKLIRSYGGKI
ncbi:MAG: hypothetical protein N3I35_00905 [Clostridia bacterium]|nr:hypothetical protein [Clostridia bacterium]